MYQSSSSHTQNSRISCSNKDIQTEHHHIQTEQKPINRTLHHLSPPNTTSTPPEPKTYKNYHIMNLSRIPLPHFLLISPPLTLPHQSTNWSSPPLSPNAPPRPPSFGAHPNAPKRYHFEPLSNFQAHLPQPTTRGPDLSNNSVPYPRIRFPPAFTASLHGSCNPSTAVGRRSTQRSAPEISPSEEETKGAVRPNRRRDMKIGRRAQ